MTVNFFGRVIQDGFTVAQVVAHTKDQMLRELGHYATLYSQEGTIKLETRSGKSAWKMLIP